MKRGARIALGTAGLLAAGASIAVASIGPSFVWGLVRYGLPGQHEGKLKPGDTPPDVELRTLAGETVHLRDRFGSKPAVLVFGSFT